MFLFITYLLLRTRPSVSLTASRRKVKKIITKNFLKYLLVDVKKIVLPKSNKLLNMYCSCYPTFKTDSSVWFSLFLFSKFGISFYDSASANIVFIRAHRGSRGTFPVTCRLAKFLRGSCGVSFYPVDLMFVPIYITSSVLQFVMFSTLSL